MKNFHQWWANYASTPLKINVNIAEIAKEAYNAKSENAFNCAKWIIKTINETVSYLHEDENEDIKNTYVEAYTDCLKQMVENGLIKNFDVENSIINGRKF